jgi:copper chaperone CopZ
MKNIFILMSLLIMFFACNNASRKTDSADIITDSVHISTLTLKIGGMTCTGCEQTICKAVGELAGVTAVTASYTDSVATVKYNAALIAPADISKKIDAVGYKVLEIKFAD